MAPSDTVSAVLEFLASYGTAFEGYDTKAIVDHYAFPCAIIGDSETITPLVFKGAEQCSAGVDYVLSLHRQVGVTQGKPLLLEITELSPRLAGMNIRYQWQDKTGKPLYDFQGFYSLARTEAGYRIAAICHNQLPRLLACAGRPSLPVS
ncbi:MAG TPA: hypothetical protein VNY08_00665 [Bradyrhizobium sp.]|jgi:hypothetical protein|nr:hypothetical protein [Bradyrhizobium sp.]